VFFQSASLKDWLRNIFPLAEINGHFIQSIVFKTLSRYNLTTRVFQKVHRPGVNVMITIFAYFCRFFLLIHFIFPASLFCSHKTVWYSCFDSGRIGSTFLWRIYPFIWYKCRYYCQCWVSVDSTPKLSRSNKVIKLLPWPLFPQGNDGDF
jgi:hypothetical protein